MTTEAGTMPAVSMAVPADSALRGSRTVPWKPRA
jgi:hypothetical protein